MRAREKNNVRKAFVILLSVVMIFSAVSFTSPKAYAAGKVTFENVDLMMIYNPLRYQKEPTTGSTAVKATASTGDMSGTIVQAAAGETAFGTQSSTNKYSTSGSLLSQKLKVYDMPNNQMAVLGPKTNALRNALQVLNLVKPAVNEKRKFYVNVGQQAEFECLAVGTTTAIWIQDGDPYKSYVQNMATALVTAMDNTVVANDHKYFGEGRFYDPDNNNLINALCHNIGSSSVMGYFNSGDLYASSEVGSWQVNTDMPIIHVNSASAKDFGVSSICSTLAHEYQHLIAATEALTNTANSNEYMESWINETMAMEAIELSYPGDCVGSQYLYQYNNATHHRDGQSLYNFDTYAGEIGAYGQAFLFGQYLEKYLGVGMFKDFHDYWRTNANQTEGEGLSTVASSGVKSEVDSTITYLDSVKTALGTDEFMSKLALCYNVSIIKQDASGKYGISFDKGKYGEGGSSPWPLMAKLNPLLFTGTKADIEGGGRILVKPKDGKYIVPNDADPNLIYVGFSKDGKTIKLDPTFAVAQYKVTYEDLAAGAVKPASSSALPEEKTYAEGTTVTVEPDLTTTETTYNGKTGTWTFDGWQPKVAGTVTITGTDTKTFTMPGKDVVLVPKWTFTEATAKFTVEYDWGTAPTGVDPAPVLPVDNTEYDTEEAAKAAVDKNFTGTTEKDGTKDGQSGKWKFSGWTPSVEGQVVKFTGSWTFTANAPSVASVTVTPATANLDAGGSQTFTAEVTGENLTDDTVTWTVEGATSADTKIDANGKLVIGADEASTNLTVRATSKQDTTKSGTAAVVVKIPEAPTPTVTAVTVTPATETMEVGTEKTFTATVTGENSPSQAVAWTVEGATSADTTIDENGKLVIGADETATTLTVRATSAQDSNKSGTATVTVTKPEPPQPTVTKVTVTPASATMEVGTEKTFTATVTGENSPSEEVTWTVEGATSADTKIDANGKLVIGADETATTLTVKATSVQDTTKSGTATVTVTKPEPPQPTVTKVEVTPASATMEVGTEKTFTATVTGENSPSEEVTWTVEGATSADTKIDANGKLVIGADETATTLTVKATSVQDTTKSGTATVTVTQKDEPEPQPQTPTVTSVTVTPATANLDAGGSQTFTAEVTGENLTDDTVTWTVEGATSADTKIDANGKLVIGADETATTLTVKATSVQDTTKSGTATVTVTQKDEPGEEPEPTPADTIPVDTTGDGKADTSVEVEKKNEDGTYVGVDGNKYFDPDGDGVYVKWLAPVLQDPPVKKVVSGKDAYGTKGRFAFTMVGSTGAPMPAEIQGKTTYDKAKNTLTAVLYGEGGIEFGNITYTVDMVPNKGDSKTFTYYLGELNTGNESYTYDTTKYTMTVTITNNGEELVKTVKYATATGKVVTDITFTNIYKSPATTPEDPTKPETSEGKTDSLIPNTGDTTERTLYAAALLFAGIGITAILPRKREDEE